MTAMKKPYTVEEMKEKMDDNGYVIGVVAVPFHSIVNTEFEGFLDILSCRLVGSELLMDVDYNVVGIDKTEDDTNILVEVKGDVSEIIADE